MAPAGAIQPSGRDVAISSCGFPIASPWVETHSDNLDCDVQPGHNAKKMISAFPFISLQGENGEVRWLPDTSNRALREPAMEVEALNGRICVWHCGVMNSCELMSTSGSFRSVGGRERRKKFKVNLAKLYSVRARFGL